MAVDIGTAQGHLDLDISKFTSALQQANAAASTQMNSMSSNFQSGLQGVGSVMTSAGKTLTTAVTAPVVALGTAAVNTTANFDKSMSKVQALSGATGKDFQTLRQKAQDMGATTRYSASEAADALGYMALAGWDTNQMVSGLDGVLNLAAASDMDLAKASDMVTDYLSAFGLEAKDAGKMADQMAYAQAHSNTSTQQLGDAFGNCAATMASGGQTMETTTALLEAMANQGTKGSEAGTQLSAIMRDLTHKMKDGAIQIGDTSVAVQDQNGNFRSLIDIMADVESATDGMGSAERAAALSSVFTAHSIKGVNQILNEGVDTIAGYEDALYNCDGTAKEMADTLLNNLSGQLTILKSALEGLAIQIGDILMPYIQKFVGWVQQLVEKFSNLSKEEKEHIIKIAAIAAAIGPLLLVGGKLLTGLATMIKTFNTLKTSFAALKTGFTGLSAAIGGISAPVVAVIAVVAALIAMFAHLWKTNEDFRNKITGIWDGIKSKFEEAGKKITEAINSLGFNFSSLGEAIYAAWDWICNALEPIISEIFANIGRLIGGVVDVVTGVVQVICGIIKGFKDGDWSLFLEGLKSLWNGFLSIITAPFVAIFNVLEGYLEKFGTSWEQIWTGIKTFFTNVWTGITTFFTNAINTIQSVATTVFTAISTFFTTIWNGIKTVFTTVINAIVQFVTNAWNNIKNVVTTVFTAVSTFIGTIWNTIFTTISTILSTIWNTIKTVFNNILLTITEIVLGVSNIITNIFNAIKEFLRGNTEQAKEHIRQAWQTAYNLVNAIINNMRNIISSVFNAIKSIIQTTMQAIQTIITTIWNAIKTVVTNVVNAIKTFISSAFTAIQNAIQTVMNAVQTFLTNTWNTIKTTVTNVVNNIKTAVSTAFTNMKSAVESTINTLKTNITNTFNNIKTAISTAMDNAKQNAINAMTNAKNGVVNVWNGIKDTFTGIGKNIIQGIIDGIAAMVSKLYDSIKDALSGLVDKAKDALGIESPSKVFRKEVGKWIPMGIADGFTAAMPAAEKQMQKDLDEMVDDLSGNQVELGIADNMMASLKVVAEYFESIEQRLVESIQNMRNSLEYLVNSGQAIINSDGTLSYVGYNGFTRVPTRATANGSTVTDVSSRTYVFYSPKAIDEIEAAKQIKRTERDIAEGFM